MQEARGIGQLGARFAGARIPGDAHVGEVGLTGFLVYAAVGELQRHLEAPVAGQQQAPGVDLAGEPDALLVGDAEQNVDRIDLRHRGEQHVRPGHVVPLGALRAAGDPGNRRLDPGVAEVEARIGEIGARGLDLGLGHLLRGSRVVVIFLACGLDFEQRLQACAVAFRLRKLRLGAGERGLGSRSGHFKGRGIDGEHRLPLRDRRAFAIVAFQDDARHARAHLDLARACRLADVFEGRRHRLRLHRYDRDFRGPHGSMRLRIGGLAAGEQWGNGCNRQCRSSSQIEVPELHSLAPFFQLGWARGPFR